MSVADLALTAMAALVIGLLIGTIGIGGVLLTPWLNQVIGLPVRDAIMISSFAFIGTGIAALVVSARSLRGTGRVDWRLVGATLPGALLGAWALSVIPGRIALALLALLTIVVGLRVLFVHSRNHDRAPARSAPELPIGVLTGFASAITGTGGPMVLTPILLWRGVPMLAAILLGQLVQLPIALTATAANLYLGGFDIGAGVAIGLMLVPGAFLGRRLAQALPLRALGRIVGVTLIAAGISFAIKATAA